MKNALLLLFATIFLFKCTTPQIAVAPSLKDNSIVYEAKGRNGWQVKQVISFGDFTTDKIKRGWTKSYDLPFIVRFQGASEKMEFEQADGKGNTAMVFTVNEFKNTEIPLLDGFFHIPIKPKDYFAGTVSLGTNQEVWDFIIYNPDGETFKNTTKGYVKNGKTEITIEGIQQLEGQKMHLNTMSYGYHFILNGEPVAAVSTLNNGSVWFRNDLNENQKLLFASLSSALMARYNMEEKVDL